MTHKNNVKEPYLTNTPQSFTFSRAHPLGCPIKFQRIPVFPSATGRHMRATEWNDLEGEQRQRTMRQNDAAEPCGRMMYENDRFRRRMTQKNDAKERHLESVEPRTRTTQENDMAEQYDRTTERQNDRTTSQNDAAERLMRTTEWNDSSAER